MAQMCVCPSHRKCVARAVIVPAGPDESEAGSDGDASDRRRLLGVDAPRRHDFRSRGPVRPDQ